MIIKKTTFTTEIHLLLYLWFHTVIIIIFFHILTLVNYLYISKRMINPYIKTNMVKCIPKISVTVSGLSSYLPFQLHFLHYVSIREYSATYSTYQIISPLQLHFCTIKKTSLSFWIKCIIDKTYISQHQTLNVVISYTDLNCVKMEN